MHSAWLGEYLLHLQDCSLLGVEEFGDIILTSSCKPKHVSFALHKFLTVSNILAPRRHRIINLKLMSEIPNQCVPTMISLHMFSPYKSIDP